VGVSSVIVGHEAAATLVLLQASLAYPAHVGVARSLLVSASASIVPLKKIYASYAVSERFIPDERYRVGELVEKKKEKERSDA